MGMKRNKGQFFLLYGSTDMRVESRVRVGDKLTYMLVKGLRHLEIQIRYHAASIT